MALQRVIYGKPPKPLGQAKMGDIAKAIAEDAGAMIVLKSADAEKLAKTAEEERKAGKCKNPVVSVGVENGNLVYLLTAEGGYSKSTILTKDYEKQKADRAKATVVNAQKGDATIDKASADMANAKGTVARSADKADLNKKGDTAPIVILAHGAPTSPLSGQVYAKEFAKKTATEIVDYLVKAKKLSTDYAGVIYLDGCYTAAGPKQGQDPGELHNFAKKVYDGLVGHGYHYLQVKGNLGQAATLKDGTERVLDAQEEAEIMRKIAAEAKAVQAKIDQLQKVSAALTARHNGNAESLKADVGIKLVTEKLEELDKERASAFARWKTVWKDHPEMRIDNLVGVFGPEKLKDEPWYKKLFA